MDLNLIGQMTLKLYTMKDQWSVGIAGKIKAQMFWESAMLEGGVKFYSEILLLIKSPGEFLV